MKALALSILAALPAMAVELQVVNARSNGLPFAVVQSGSTQSWTLDLGTYALCSGTGEVRVAGSAAGVEVPDCYGARVIVDDSGVLVDWATGSPWVWFAAGFVFCAGATFTCYLGRLAITAGGARLGDW